MHCVTFYFVKRRDVTKILGEQFHLSSRKYSSDLILSSGNESWRFCSDAAILFGFKQFERETLKRTTLRSHFDRCRDCFLFSFIETYAIAYFRLKMKLDRNEKKNVYQIHAQRYQIVSVQRKTNYWTELAQALKTHICFARLNKIII